MATDNFSELMQSLITKLYAVITNDDTNIKIPRNKSVSWWLPGLPFDPKDFMFCAKGLHSDDADEVSLLYQQAYTISKLFDFVPDTFIDSEKMEQTIFTSSQDTISSVYGDILTYCQVANREISAKEQETIQKYRNLLTTVTEREDIMNPGEMKRFTEDSPLTVAYTEKQSEYEVALNEYNNLIIDGLSATGKDPEAVRRVQAAARMSKFLSDKVNSAYKRWVSQGYKNEFEQMNAYIHQATQKSMVMYKDALQQKYEGARLDNIAIGGELGKFYFTTLVPGNFATSGGWTQFTFFDQDYHTHYKKSTEKWGASARVNLGFVRFGGSGGGSKEQISSSVDMSKFRISLKFAQVPILRPFMDPGLFTMRGWRLGKEWFDNYPNQTVSDGNADPKGRLIAYPITALFIRDVEITSSELASQYDSLQKHVSGGGSAGFGPIRVGGSYSYGKEKRDTSFHRAGDTLKIPGMQLIGFINHTVPKCPDTNPEIEDSLFV